jgi:hypothetical protein
VVGAVGLGVFDRVDLVGLWGERGCFEKKNLEEGRGMEGREGRKEGRKEG